MPEKRGSHLQCPSAGRVKLTDVYYGGTWEQWNQTKKQKGNDALGSAEFHEKASSAALQTAAQFFF